jgi:hypothetical protein
VNPPAFRSASVSNKKHWPLTRRLRSANHLFRLRLARPLLGANRYIKVVSSADEASVLPSYLR